MLVTLNIYDTIIFSCTAMEVFVRDRVHPSYIKQNVLSLPGHSL